MNLALVLQTGVLPVEDRGVQVLEVEVDQFATVGNQFFHFLKAHLAHVFEVQLRTSPATVGKFREGVGAAHESTGFLKLVNHGGEFLRVVNKRANVAQGFLVSALALFVRQVVEVRQRLRRGAEVVLLHEVAGVQVTDSFHVKADKVLGEKSVHGWSQKSCN